MRVMAAKKREVSAVKEKKSSLKEKYLRRAEVESLLEQEQEEREQEHAPKKRKLDQSSPDHKQEETTAQETQADEEGEALLSWPDMRKRLRELGEPITLFGENMQDRMKRLRRAEIDSAAKHEDDLGAGHDRFVGGDDAEPREQLEAAAEDAEAASSDKKESEDEEQDADKMVYRFFKGMLQRWEKDLASRPDHVKRTAQGKIAVKTMKQCKDYIRPLFKLCKQRQVPPDILPNLVDIVKFCRQGEFVQANDAYIKLAIGNAAWPIGVTMVGIHERTGREKINSNKQAHVMNNESQRKYLTSVKRLMSYAQSISNVLPSKRVL